MLFAKKLKSKLCSIVSYKKINYILLPVLVSLTVTVSNYYFEFVPENKFGIIFLVTKLISAFCAIFQVVYNCKKNVYTPLNNVKLSFVLFVIFFIIFLFCYTYSPPVYFVPFDYSTNIITILVYKLLRLFISFIYTLVVHMFDCPISYVSIHLWSLAHTLVAFFSVYFLLSSAIRYIKTKKLNANAYNKN